MSSRFLYPPAHKTGTKSLLCLCAILLVALAFPLSSCTKFLTGTPVKLIQLHPQMPTMTISKSIPYQMLINLPSAPPALGGDSITLLFNQREYKYIADTKWISPLPNLFQSVLIDAFESAKIFQNVASNSSGISGQVMLLSDIREFTLSYETPSTLPAATIKIIFYLVDTTSGNTISSLSLNETEIAKGIQLEDLMEAYDKSLEKVLSDVVSWTAKNLENKKI